MLCSPGIWWHSTGLICDLCNFLFPTFRFRILLDKCFSQRNFIAKNKRSWFYVKTFDTSKITFSYSSWCMVVFIWCCLLLRIGIRIALRVFDWIDALAILWTQLNSRSFVCFFFCYRCVFLSLGDNELKNQHKCNSICFALFATIWPNRITM